MAKSLVLGLKTSRDFRRAKLIGRLIDVHFDRLFYNIDIVCPVPLSNGKLQMREFNQVSLILHHVSKLRSKIVYDLLLKTKETSAQSTLGKSQRKRNLKGAFALNDNYNSRLDLHKKRIAIFDDIVTTATTVNECSKVLLKAGASSVEVFSFARA